VVTYCPDAAALVGALAAAAGVPYIAGAQPRGAGLTSQGVNFLFLAPPPLPLPGARPDSALAAALIAVRAAAVEGQARVRAAALVWEHERDAADALARQIAEAE
jgi:hypothetical protein